VREVHLALRRLVDDSSRFPVLLGLLFRAGYRVLRFRHHWRWGIVRCIAQLFNAVVVVVVVVVLLLLRLPSTVIVLVIMFIALRVVEVLRSTGGGGGAGMRPPPLHAVNPRFERCVKVSVHVHVVRTRWLTCHAAWSSSTSFHRERLERAGRKDVEDMNIVLFYADDWTCSNLGFVNKVVKTPNISNGVHFPHNCVTTGICCQSRATKATGLYASVHQNLRIWSDNRFGKTVNWRNTLYPKLKEAGYNTGFFGK
jgi:hypothetical protein